MDNDTRYILLSCAILVGLYKSAICVSQRGQMGSKFGMDSENIIRFLDSIPNFL